MNVLILLMWLWWTVGQTPATLKDLVVFLWRRKRDSGNVINVIFTEFFLHYDFKCSMSGFWERFHIVQQAYENCAQKVIWYYRCLLIPQKAVLFFSSSNTSRPVFGKVSDAFVWCNGHTQWPVGLITYVYSLWISEAVCSRNFFLYTMTAWNLTW